MATTLRESFRQYARNLEITDNQSTIVSNCRRNVTTKLGAKLSLHDEKSKVIGSWDRRTLTRRLSEADVDVMVILHYGKNKGWDNGDGTVNALDKFKSILQEAYPNTTMRRDVNCITMKLNQFRLDVVPAFKWDSGFYKIPDSVRRQWVPTDPFTFASWMTTVNTSMGGDFKPLVKMVKGWNREVGWPLRSLHLEALMYLRYRTYPESYTYDSMLNNFFAALPNYLRTACYEPVKGDRLDTYLDTSSTRTRASAIVKAEKAAELSAAAYSWANIDPERSIRIWKTLLGEFFPTYG
jgi:hypothetical protein